MGDGGMTRPEVMARIHDWLHEREIRRLGRACVEAMEAHDTAKAVHFWVAHGEAIKARSASQIQRMERKRGLA